jgi:O-antigen/teichoic acid export membrane protein
MYFGIGIVASAILICADPFLGHVSASGQLVAAAAIFGTLLPNVLRPNLLVLQANNRFDLDRLAEALGVVARIAATSFAILMHASFVVVVCTEVIPLWFPGIVAIALRKRVLPRTDVPDMPTKADRRDILRFVTNAGVGSALGAGALQLTPALAATGLPPAQLVAFGVAYRIYVAVRRPISWIIDPHLPAVASAVARSRAAAASAYSDVASQCIVLVALAVVPAAVLAPPAFKIFFPRIDGAGAHCVVLLITPLLLGAVAAPAPLLAAVLNVPHRLVRPAAIAFALTLVIVPAAARLGSAITVSAVVGALGAFAQLLLLFALRAEFRLRWRTLIRRIGRHLLTVCVGGAFAYAARTALSNTTESLLAGASLYSVVVATSYGSRVIPRSFTAREA